MHVADVFIDDDFDDRAGMTDAERRFCRNVNVHRPLADFRVDGKASLPVLAYLLKKYEPSISSVQSAIINAIELDAPECISLLYKYAREHKNLSSMWAKRFGLVAKLSTLRSTMACCDAAWEGNAALPVAEKLSFSCFAESYTKNSFYEALIHLFDTKATAGDSKTYWALLVTCLDQSIDRPSLEKLLSLRDRFPMIGGEASDALRAAAKSNVAAVAVIEALQSSCDITACVTQELVNRFLAHDNMAAVDLLAGYGVDFSPYAEMALKNAGKDIPSSKVFTYLDRFCGGRFFAARAEEDRLQLQSGRFSVVDRDTLLEKKRIPDQGTLSIMFNFATRQQILIIRSSSGMSMVTNNFSDLNDLDVLKLAADRFVALDGNPALTEGIVMRLKKAALPMSNPKK